MSEHRFIALVWKPDGRTAQHRARCLCGWVSNAAEVGYGYPLSHEDDHAQHVREATCSQAPHPGREFYGAGGCGECGFVPSAATA